MTSFPQCRVNYHFTFGIYTMQKAIATVATF